MDHDALAHTETPAPSSDRVFGLVFVAVFAALAVRPLISGDGPRWWALAGAVLVGLCAWLAPHLLAPCNRAWSRCGALLHRLVNPLVLGFIYYLVITPMGVVMRMRGKDLLRLRLDSRAMSYWIKRDPPGPAGDTLKNPF